MISLEAPAKLNLSLRVVGERPDGFHLLETEMALLKLADQLLLLPGAAGLRVEGPPGEEIPLDRSNLAWRGLLAGLGVEPQLICLTLEKRIPAAAGLGGGSSDAAAAWRLGRHASGASDAASPEELASLALIGADVPFFAAQRAVALVSGIGEVVAPAPPRAATPVILVHPGFPLTTRAVFADLRPADLASDRSPGNDLLAPALRLRPELGDLMARMAKGGIEPQLTGSGPTLFSLVDDPEQAAATTARLRSMGLRVTQTRLRTLPAAIVEIDDARNDAGAPQRGVG